MKTSDLIKKLDAYGLALFTAYQEEKESKDKCTYWYIAQLNQRMKELLEQAIRSGYITEAEIEEQFPEDNQPTTIVFANLFKVLVGANQLLDNKITTSTNNALFRVQVGWSTANILIIGLIVSALLNSMTLPLVLLGAAVVLSAFYAISGHMLAANIDKQILPWVQNIVTKQNETIPNSEPRGGFVCQYFLCHIYLPLSVYSFAFYHLKTRPFLLETQGYPLLECDV